MPLAFALLYGFGFKYDAADPICHACIIHAQPFAISAGVYYARSTLEERFQYSYFFEQIYGLPYTCAPSYLLPFDLLGHSAERPLQGALSLSERFAQNTMVTLS